MRAAWQDAVVYQVYLRSYRDSDGDGVGDLPGLLERLDHIAGLADALWLTPFQPSPQVDNGYDVADYVGVDPLFGTPADLRAVVAAAHERDLGVLVDIVPNHCSREHPLFQAALAAGPGSPERELFWFRPGTADDQPPNNWTSVFGGPAWTRAHPGSATDEDYYLHLFDDGQPDWNWEHPAVHAFFDDVLRFWFDLGVDGVRIDVAHALYKAPGLPDAPPGTDVVDGLRANPLVSDQEAVHAVYRRWRVLADSYDPPRFLVGEVNLAPARAARFARPDELDQVFPFAFVALGWDAERWCETGRALEEAAGAEGAARAWALENHDIVRAVTRYGDGEQGRRRARAALVALLGLPGTAYLYQGQELGLPEVDVPMAARRDPMWERGGVCRDGARVPLPWQRATDGAHGFSAVAGAAPWLPQPPGWGERAIEAQDGDPSSMLTLARDAVAARRHLTALGLGATDALRWEVTPTGGLRVTRAGRLCVVVAMGDGPEPLPAGRVLLASEPCDGDVVPTGSAAWVLL